MRRESIADEIFIAEPGEIDRNREKYIIATYHIECNPDVFDSVAQKMAVTASFGSSFIPERVDPVGLKERSAKLIYHARDTSGGTVRIAYSAEASGLHEGIPQLLNTLLYICGYHYFSSIRLTNFEPPQSFVEQCRSPYFGINKIREMLREDKNPLLAFTLKPRIAKLSHYEDVAYRACKGGADLVIDDELNVDPQGTDLALDKRVPAVKRAVEKAASKEHPKKYIVNVTGNIPTMKRLVDRALSLGADGILFNAFATGFAAAEEIVKLYYGKVPVFMNKIGGVTLSGSERSGIDEAILCKLCRLIGADAVYTSSFEGDVWWTQSRVKFALSALRSQMGKINSSFSVATGGLNFKNLFKNLKIQGRDSIFSIGRGIYEYPGGPEKGARAFKKLLTELSPDMSQDQASAKFGELRHDPNIEQGLLLDKFDDKKDLSV